ncbi:MAG: MliC family protein [Rickettsiales bacterium]|jgi:membrane-bound inhibitor of C-type lysozyme|nr:MliC family protein [Rickettsiales bacterium]
MKKLIFCLIAATTLAACKSPDKPMKCGEYEVFVSVSENGDYLKAVINGDNVVLENKVSASGARYVGVLNDTEVTLWSKGQDWMLIINGDQPIDCVR